MSFVDEDGFALRHAGNILVHWVVCPKPAGEADINIGRTKGDVANTDVRPMLRPLPWQCIDNAFDGSQVYEVRVAPALGAHQR